MSFLPLPLLLFITIRQMYYGKRKRYGGRSTARTTRTAKRRTHIGRYRIAGRGLGFRTGSRRKVGVRRTVGSFKRFSSRRSGYKRHHQRVGQQTTQQFAWSWVRAGQRIPQVLRARDIYKTAQENQTVVVLEHSTPAILNHFILAAAATVAGNAAQKGAVLNLKQTVRLRNLSGYRYVCIAETWTTRRTPPTNLWPTIASIVNNGYTSPFTLQVTGQPIINWHTPGVRLQQNRIFNMYFKRVHAKKFRMDAFTTKTLVMKQFMRKPGYQDVYIHTEAPGAIGASVSAFSGEGGVRTKFMTVIMYADPEATSETFVPPGPSGMLNYPPVVFGIVAELTADYYWPQYATQSYAVGTLPNDNATAIEIGSKWQPLVYTAESTVPSALNTGGI